MRLAGLPRVFDDDAHAMGTILFIEVTENPHAGMIHFDDRGDAFGGAEPEDGDFRGSRNRIAVERDNFESVARKSQAANFGGAAVEDVEEDALAGFDANGFAVAEHAAIDGEGPIADFEAVRHAFGQRRFHCGFAGLPKGFVRLARRKKILCHVAAAGEGGLEFLQSEEHFAVVTAGFVAWLDIDRSDLAGILACAKVGASAIVRVIEAESGRPRSEDDATMAVRGNIGRAFFGGAVDVNRNLLAVPVELLGSVGVVADVDGGLLAFPEAEERAGELAVVRYGGNDAFAGYFEGRGLDVDDVVGKGFVLESGGDHMRTGFERGEG